MDIRPLREPGKGHWLLARRSVAKPGELAYYVCFGPAGTGLKIGFFSNVDGADRYFANGLQRATRKLTPDPGP